MTREFRHALDDILEAIAGIEAATSGKTFASYKDDWLTKRAVERGIEIISEASRALPNEVTTLRPEIPWRRVRGIGNVIRHEYYELADAIIWGVVFDELPALKGAVEALKAQFDKS